VKLKTKSRKFLCRRSFTLVELLAVIMIISLLASLLFVGITSIKDKGNQVKCMNNLKQLSLAVTQFSRDSDVFPDRDRWLATDAGRGARTGQLYRYLGDAKLYACPSDTVLTAGLDSGQAPRLTSYAYNGWFSGKNANLSVDMSAAVVFIEPDMPDQGPGTTSFEGAGAPLLTTRHRGGGLIAYGDGHTEHYIRIKYEANKAKIFQVTQ
jgi:prepilin-type N-terminal cleavage/methylation domain-containing protein